MSIAFPKQLLLPLAVCTRSELHGDAFCCPGDVEMCWSNSSSAGGTFEGYFQFLSAPGFGSQGLSAKPLQHFIMRSYDFAVSVRDLLTSAAMLLPLILRL